MSNDFSAAALEAALSRVSPTVLADFLTHLTSNPGLTTVLIQEMERDYTGASLDAQLAEFGQHRLLGESDWEFRRRTFPAVFGQNEEEAIRIIFTCPHTLLTGRDRSLLASLALDTSPAGLRKWADGFGFDPHHTYHGL